MKKYKLIKEYPGSPELGFEIDLNKIQTCVFTWNELDKTNSFCNYKTRSHYTTDISHNPEFWQEVIEKEYEVLSFLVHSNCAGSKGNIYYLQSNGRFKEKSYFQDYNITEFINTPSIYSIHSVKRLSDNTTWTIGDYIKHGTCTYQIEGFNTKCEGTPTTLLVKLKNNGSVCLSNIKCTTRIPLFTTEDGVEIYEGDIYAIVDDTLTIIPPYPPVAMKGKNVMRGNYYGYKYFSTKEAAEEYCRLYKPCLNLNEVNSLVLGYCSSPTTLFQKLSELVKSKLNK